MGKYKIMTSKELSKYVCNKLESGEMLSFKFWDKFNRETAEQEEDDSNFVEPHGIKTISLFNNNNPLAHNVLAIGCIGGGSTEVFDYTYNTNKDNITSFLCKYIEMWCGSDPILVEVK